MSQNLLEGIKVKSVFHPSDFSEASEVAFAHALKIALGAGAKLTVLHRAPESQYRMAGLPRRPRHARALGAHPERKSQKRSRAARHQGRQSYRVEQRSGESLSWLSGKA